MIKVMYKSEKWRETKRFLK